MFSPKLSKLRLHAERVDAIFAGLPDVPGNRGNYFCRYWWLFALGTEPRPGGCTYASSSSSWHGRDQRCRILPALGIQMTSAAIIGVLGKHVSEKRLTRLATVLRSRVRDTTLVFENLGDPHNIAACLRTADALGVQDGERGMGLGDATRRAETTLFSPYHFFPWVTVHVIERWNEHFFPSQQTSQGASKWLTLHRHASVPEWCVVSEGPRLPSSPRVLALYCSANSLRSDGFALCATDLGAGAVSLSHAISTVSTRQSCTDSSPALPMSLRRRVALCFGNERRGVSAALRASSDIRFYIPMLGFVQSLNVSVAVALATAAFLHRTPDYADRAAAAHESLLRAAAFTPSAEEKRAQLLDRRLMDAVADDPGAAADPSGDVVSPETKTCSPGAHKSLRYDGLVCEGLSNDRYDDVLARWLLTEVAGASELLTRAGVRPLDL